MSSTPLHNPVWMRGWHRIREYSALPWVAGLAMQNRFSRKKITNEAGPVVSLTSYGRRMRTVYLTIESIARGCVRPSQLILWVDDKETYRTLPATLCRLQARGLEIGLCSNYGPHTKYYPYVASRERFSRPMITADDDILYPRWWLERLVASLREYPDAVSCHLAKKVELDDHGIARYAAWKIPKTTFPSACHVAHGVNGVIFPPPLLEVLKRAGDGFQHCCPRADDIWLHAQALRAGFKVRQIRPAPRRFAAIPGTQEYGLWIGNNAEGNDQAISATYTKEDIARLRASARNQRAVYGD